jgi:D-alanyl-D-alanine carboxypeptidase
MILDGRQRAVLSKIQSGSSLLTIWFCPYAPSRPIWRTFGGNDQCPMNDARPGGPSRFECFQCASIAGNGHTFAGRSILLVLSLLTFIAFGTLPPEGWAAGPPTVQANGSQQDQVRRGMVQIAATHNLAQVWFRAEIPGQPPLELAIGGGAATAVLPVASLSKSVTAIGVALLIQRGKLRLNTRLGDILTGYFQSHGSTMDASLQPITIDRLLSHTAGLRTNGVVDRVNGISSGKVIAKLGGDAPFFDYIIAADAAKSDGSNKFLYSNLSYLVLGMVIEAVSGSNYESFCQQNIFRPLGITDAMIPANWRIVAPFAGWHLTLRDQLRLWQTFDERSPAILTVATLQSTLLGHLGQPMGNGGNVYYTLGTYVRQDRPGAGYVVSHNGIADFVPHEPLFYSFEEKMVPGRAWIMVTSPMPAENDAPSVNRDVRQLLETISHGN